MKICSKCKVEKPFDEFYKQSSSKDGHNSWCKHCTKHRQILEKTNPIDLNNKICSKCKLEKPLSNFAKTKKIKSGYISICKKCRWATEKKRRKTIPIAKKLLIYKKHRNDRSSKIKIYRKVYKKINLEKVKESVNQAKKKAVSELRDGYVIKSLVQNHGWTREQVINNPELIKLHRILLNIQRHAKEK